MPLPEFIQRHGAKDKREMKAEGVDGDGNPVTFEFTLHERPLPGHETDGDVTAYVELSIKYVRAIDKELEWQMRDLELLEGSKLFRTASYVSDDTKRLETFKKWLGQLRKLYHHKLPGKPSAATAHFPHHALSSSRPMLNHSLALQDRSPGENDVTRSNSLP
ncbi:unnamed protein product [Closterium sp. NIES-64]|nr:unnamed protein product [Closterium sp. NIES-64]